MNVKAKRPCETDLRQPAGKQWNGWIGWLSEWNHGLAEPPQPINPWILHAGIFHDPHIHIFLIKP
jgi:hypothetical protein